MKIEFQLNEQAYTICVESNSYVLNKVVTVQDKESKNYGVESERALGWFTTIGNAALRAVREEIATNNDVVSLLEYTNRITALNEQIKEQFKAVEV